VGKKYWVLKAKRDILIGVQPKWSYDRKGQQNKNIV